MFKAVLVPINWRKCSTFIIQLNLGEMDVTYMCKYIGQDC